MNSARFSRLCAHAVKAAACAPFRVKLLLLRLYKGLGLGMVRLGFRFRFRVGVGVWGLAPGFRFRED